jgi:hypothetical protein
LSALRRECNAKQDFNRRVSVIAVLLVVILTRPSDFRITRSIVINAPSATVFGYVNDLHRWSDWSPWVKLDPNAKMTFEGPNEGVGAISRWSGNDKVGAGSQTIVESRLSEFIRIDQEFIRPFQGKSMVEFAFKAEANQTTVSWSMYGKNNFMGKAMSLLMNCDKMVGGEFEKGLTQLKMISEQTK